MSIKPIEVFQFLKPKFNYIALDSSRRWTAYIVKPIIDSRLKYWIGTDSPVCEGFIFAIDIDYTGDWKDSLFKRSKE